MNILRPFFTGLGDERFMMLASLKIAKVNRSNKSLQAQSREDVEFLEDYLTSQRLPETRKNLIFYSSKFKVNFASC